MTQHNQTPARTNNYARLGTGELVFFDDTRPGALVRLATRIAGDKAAALFREPPPGVVERADAFAKAETTHAGVNFDRVKLITTCPKGGHYWWTPPASKSDAEHCERCSIKRMGDAA